MRVILTATAGPHAGAKTVFDGHGTLLVGRAPEATFRLPQKDRFFSRFHFLVEVNPPHCRIVDLGSRNGTFVNGRRVRAADLSDGDEIKAGHTRLAVAVESRPATPARPVAKRKQPAADAPKLDWRGKPAAQAVEVSGTIRPTDFDSKSAMPSAANPPVVVGERCRVCGAAGVPPVTSDRRHPLCAACERLLTLPPQPFPGYGVVGELGRGAMGVVYKAVHLATGSLVALKTIVPAIRTGETERKRFLREADTLRSLRHPRIIAVHDSGEADGLLYFAMEFVSGIDGNRLLNTAGPPGGLPVQRGVRVACQLLEALEYAHARGYVHRDVKPANLLVQTVHGGLSVRLADFGLARLYQESSLSGITLIGPEGMGGTPAFMPPEQIIDFRTAQPPADLFSTGATLYTLLTGRPIYDFDGCNWEQRLLKILEAAPVPIRERRGDIPTALARVIHQAIRKEPDARPKSAGEFRTALLPFA